MRRRGERVDDQGPWRIAPLTAREHRRARAAWEQIARDLRENTDWSLDDVRAATSVLAALAHAVGEYEHRRAAGRPVRAWLSRLRRASDPPLSDALARYAELTGQRVFRPRA